ncbi:annexin D8-like [Tripterygium wilfordii]|uniref:annexin D8-like n=1 Tax=Tripterygium wilfordii TaxID=458696 RepID=UPI0018F82828|nr:annexin D8-like [Tripterygium wilfordii]
MAVVGNNSCLVNSYGNQLQVFLSQDYKLSADEKAIISMLGHRNSFQRKLIRQAYREIYQEELIKQLKSEISRHFEVFYPTELTITTTWVLIEIACIRSPEDLLTVKSAYLEEDVASRITCDIRKLLVGMASCYRYDGEEIDEGVLVSEANIRHYEIKERL